MNLTLPSSSKMDEERIKNARHDLTYVIFRFEDKSIAPVPVTWIVNDLTEEYNECCWPEHLSTNQIATAMKDYSTDRKETWPKFKGVVLDVYLNFEEASKSCYLYKITETRLKDELQIEEYFKSQSTVFRHAEKSERVKLNKISKKSNEEICLLQETGTIIEKKFQGLGGKRTLEEAAPIGLQADLQAYIKKVEQKRANIEIYKEKVEEKKNPKVMAEHDEHKNMSENKVNKQPAKNNESPSNFISSICQDGRPRGDNEEQRGELEEENGNHGVEQPHHRDPSQQQQQKNQEKEQIGEEGEDLNGNHKGDQPPNGDPSHQQQMKWEQDPQRHEQHQQVEQEVDDDYEEEDKLQPPSKRRRLNSENADLELDAEQDSQHYTADLIYHRSTYFETQLFAEKFLSENSIILQNNNDNVGRNAFISQLKGLKENINQCENHFNSFIKECEPLKNQDSTSTTSNDSKIKFKKLEQNINFGWCLEHSANLLNLRCLTHKAWICQSCCEDDHPKNDCKIITFEEELKARKCKEEQRLLDESKKISITVSSLFEFGNKKERERNENVLKLRAMQSAIKKLICDINQQGNEMSTLNEVMSEGKELQQKLNEKKDDVSNTTTISELVSFTKSYSEILTESINWCEKHQKND